MHFFGYPFKDTHIAGFPYSALGEAPFWTSSRLPGPALPVVDEPHPGPQRAAREVSSAGSAGAGLGGRLSWVLGFLTPSLTQSFLGGQFQWHTNTTHTQHDLFAALFRKRGFLGSCVGPTWATGTARHIP